MTAPVAEIMYGLLYFVTKFDFWNKLYVILLMEIEMATLTWYYLQLNCIAWWGDKLDVYKYEIENSIQDK
jgi:hypothetical protein